MNDRQNAKLNMAQRVSETLKRYETEYSNIAPMVAVVAELNEGIKNIRDTQKEHVAVNVSASTLEKRTAETQMILPSVRIANAFYVIGFNSDNKDLITLHGFSENSFYRLSGNASLALARQMLDLANNYANELKNYGITETEIKTLEKAIETFNTTLGKPMDTIGERKQRTTNLMQLFAGLDSIFYDKLDKLMILFKQSSHDFYDEYRTARNIIFNIEHRKKEVAK
jgi:hypothetical protein